MAKRGRPRKVGKPGRRPHQPTDPLRNLVRICAALGKSQEMTAALVGIDHDTLMKNYRDDFVYGRDNVAVAVATKLVPAATAPEHTGATVSAAQFWARTQMGFRESSVVEVHKTQGDGLLTAGMSQQEAVRCYLDSLRAINAKPVLILRLCRRPR
jgi:hypothetical protein